MKPCATVGHGVVESATLFILACDRVARRSISVFVAPFSKRSMYVMSDSVFFSPKTIVALGWGIAVWESTCR